MDPANPQPHSPAFTIDPQRADAVYKHLQAARDEIFDELAELCAINSLALNDETAEDIAHSAQLVHTMFTTLGLEAETITTSDSSPTVIGRKKARNGAPTVLLYCHHDIVPVGDDADWSFDAHTLTERDGRWYARGAADCKGNIVMHLATLRAVEATGGCDTGVIVVCEGSEERGGQGLKDLVDQRPELFEADLICIVDTASGFVGTPTLTTTLRGGAQLTVTVDTLKAPVHSGQFGGAAPDAVAVLARILATIHDEDGRIAIDGLNDADQWEGSPFPGDNARDAAGLLDGVDLLGTNDDEMADLVWARPAITITGFSSTPVDEAVNAVPATGSAQLNLRVPPGVDTAATAKLVAAHLENHAEWGAHASVEITEANPSFAADTSGPLYQHLHRCFSHAYGTETQEIGTGGSIPLTIALHRAFPKAEFGLYGVAESASAIHSGDESVDPQEIIRQAYAQALVLTGLGEAAKD